MVPFRSTVNDLHIRIIDNPPFEEFEIVTNSRMIPGDPSTLTRDPVHSLEGWISLFKKVAMNEVTGSGGVNAGKLNGSVD